MICLPTYHYHGYLFCCLHWRSVPYCIYSVVNVLWATMQTFARCVLMPNVKVLDDKLRFKKSRGTVSLNLFPDLKDGLGNQEESL